MLDSETFLTEVYVVVDQTMIDHFPADLHPGPRGGLCRSEVVTLALFGQFARFTSERDFYRYATTKLRSLFPGLPSRGQFNRLVRRHREATTGFALHLAELLGARTAEYELLDGTGVPTRNAKRRGRGWLCGQADIGRCTRLGWYEGVRLLVAATPDGAITGFGLGPASTQDRVLAETFFARRAKPDRGLASVGQPAASGDYAADMGFSGKDCTARWAAAYAAKVCSPPQPDANRTWHRQTRRWLAAIRQVIETVQDRLLSAFRLADERPHDLTGIHARLAAKVALHNAVIWLNRKYGHPDLAIAEVLGWD